MNYKMDVGTIVNTESLDAEGVVRRVYAESGKSLDEIMAVSEGNPRNDYETVGYDVFAVDAAVDGEKVGLEVLIKETGVADVFRVGSPFGR